MLRTLFAVFVPADPHDRVQNLARLGISYVAYTVSTADGNEYLIYYRLLKEKLAGQKPADFAGRKLRVVGVSNRTATGGTFNRLDFFELDREP